MIPPEMSLTAMHMTSANVGPEGPSAPRGYRPARAPAPRWSTVTTRVSGPEQLCVSVEARRHCRRVLFLIHTHTYTYIRLQQHAWGPGAPAARATASCRAAAQVYAGGHLSSRCRCCSLGVRSPLVRPRLRGRLPAGGSLRVSPTGCSAGGRARGLLAGRALLALLATRAARDQII